MGNMTFSMIAQGQDTGRFDIIVSTYTPAVDGAICACSPNRGIAIMQVLGPAERLVRAGKLLDVNNDGAWIVDALSLSGSHPELRQLAAINSASRAATCAGKKEPFMGRHVVGDGYVAAGNVLIGERLVAYMAKTYGSAARS
jgi:uncharacterized Ntn-hydrolase superfamily protein